MNKYYDNCFNNHLRNSKMKFVDFMMFCLFMESHLLSFYSHHSSARACFAIIPD